MLFLRFARNIAMLAVLAIGGAVLIAPPGAQAQCPPCAGTGWCGCDYSCCYNDCYQQNCANLTGADRTSCQAGCQGDCTICADGS
jgi:hypothetical protein